jgi:hypothetical protein
MQNVRQFNLTLSISNVLTFKVFELCPENLCVCARARVRACAMALLQPFEAYWLHEAPTV